MYFLRIDEKVISRVTFVLIHLTENNVMELCCYKVKYVAMNTVLNI